MSNSGSQVDIDASTGNPGNPAKSEDPGPSGRAPAASAEQPAPQPCEATPVGCRGNYTVVSIPEVTLADLASFRPAAPTLTGEPTGFGVVGMPANLVAAASEQQMPGRIFDFDVVVRFVPVAFDFEYGDGSSARTTTGGASWSQLGLAQFTPTATSHVYRGRGTYPVSVTVRYAASVDFGAGWRPVAGFVSATTGGYDVRVVEVQTALVARTCDEAPSGPGC
ncbi:hypothetical protein ACH3VR_18605 [Microbacterium sp. B2969]|uniref:PKD domain-containing protein n=1 Tax=Microbacterium alkaliflavum TaxID=3248839 RepID=A0ABW7QBV6_9MICO